MTAGDATDTEWETARRALAGTRFADLQVVAETGSTNADLLARARAGAPEGAVLVADHQRAGRGRHDRRWEAPPGSSLLVSILTRPADAGVADHRLHLVPAALGVAAAEAARAATGAQVRLKWPNDLVAATAAGTRKLSGTLAESVVTGGRVEALVVGIGINVNWGAGPHGDLDGIATALDELAGRPVDRVALLVDLLVGFARWYPAATDDEGVAELRRRSRALSDTIGRRVRVTTAAGPVVGDAIDVDDDGHLLVVDECPDRPRVITAGDVVTVRPSG